MVYLIFIIIAIVFSILYFKKHPYISTNKYPMKFHSFFLKYFVPFSIAIHFADALAEISNEKIVAFTYQFVVGILYLCLFIKLQKLENPSLYLIFGLTSVFYGFNLIATIILARINNSNFDSLSVVSSFIWFCVGVYISLYYYQRREIFISNDEELLVNDVQSNTRDINESNEQICYCRKCGASIPSDSVYCPSCGEKI